MKLLKEIKKGLVEVKQVNQDTLTYLVENQMVGIIGSKLYLKENGLAMLSGYDKKMAILQQIADKISELEVYAGEIEASLVADMQKCEEPETVISFQATLQPQTTASAYTQSDFICPSCLYKGPMQALTSEQTTAPSTTQPQGQATGGQEMGTAQETNPNNPFTKDPKLSLMKSVMAGDKLSNSQMRELTNMVKSGDSDFSVGVSKQGQQQLNKALQQQQQQLEKQKKETEQSLRAAQQRDAQNQQVVEGIDFGSKMKKGTVRDYEQIYLRYKSL